MTDRRLAETALAPVAGGVGAVAAGVLAPAGASVLAATLVGVAVALAVGSQRGDPRYLSLVGLGAYLAIGGAAVEGPVPAEGVLPWAVLGTAAAGATTYASRIRYGNLRRAAALPYDPSALRRAVSTTATHLLTLRRGVRRAAPTRDRALGLSAGVAAVALVATAAGSGAVAAGAEAVLAVALYAPFYVLTDWRALDGLEPVEDGDVPDRTGFAERIARTAGNGGERPDGPVRTAVAAAGGVVVEAVDGVRTRATDDGVLGSTVETLDDALESLGTAAEAASAGRTSADGTTTEPARTDGDEIADSASVGGTAERPTDDADTGPTAPTVEPAAADRGSAANGDRSGEHAGEPPVTASASGEATPPADETADATTGEPADTTAVVDAPVYTAAARTDDDADAGDDGEEREGTVIDAAAAFESSDDVATDGSGRPGDRTAGRSRGEIVDSVPVAPAPEADDSAPGADDDTGMDAALNVADRVDEILENDDEGDEWVDRMEFLDSTGRRR